MLIEYNGMLLDADSIRLRAEEFSHSYYENEYSEGELILEADLKGYTKDFPDCDEIYGDIFNTECVHHPVETRESLIEEDHSSFIADINKHRCPCYVENWNFDGRLYSDMSESIRDAVEYGRIPAVLQTYIQLKDLVIAKLKAETPLPEGEKYA